MWLLRNDSKGLIYRVTPGKQHVVGRKDGDLVLLGDQSISRKHAQVQVDEENETNGIILSDLGSKYGTFAVIRGGELVQLSPREQATLRNGDSVRFGVQWNCWRTEFVHLLVATSTLTQEEKVEVKQMLASLGGRVVSEWQAECSHLTMNKLTVTVKVVCALASGQLIVTPSYWRSFSQAVSTMQATLPDCKDFVPPLAEAMLNPSEVSFTPNTARSKLFQGYTLVAASTKQLNRIRPMITAAGGSAVEFSARMWTEDKLMEEKNILMLTSANDRQGSQQSQVFDGYIPVARKLKSKGVRCIPESEIGLSVIYCSLSQYCNPRFSSQSLINSSGSGQATQHVTVICPSTEESLSTDQDDINTVPEPYVQSTTKKRTLEDVNEVQEPLSKRPDLRGNSEDLFGSQHLNNSKTNIGRALSLKKSASSNKQSAQEINQAKNNPDPSLDMFAPSGERSGPSKVNNQNAAGPSCEDLFASTGSGQLLNRGSKDAANDEFSFTQNRNLKQPVDEINKDEGAVPFASAKKIRKSQSRTENVVDKFCFISNKTINATLQSEPDEEDAFSFTSAKRPNKRNRQSNPDIFASSGESSIINNDSFAGPSNKHYDNFSFLSAKQNASQDNPFAFPDDHNPKKRRVNDQVLDFTKMGNEVKIALLSNDSQAEAEPNSLHVQQECEDPPEPKNLTTYSKLNPMPVKPKEEVENEEMDGLAKELFNATIVVVKPLVVVREPPQKILAPIHTGKNFKTFRKVVGIQKRIIPHIIGGRDLVPHYNVGQGLENKAPLPVHDILEDNNDDEWAFDRARNKRRAD